MPYELENFSLQATDIRTLCGFMIVSRSSKFWLKITENVSLLFRPQTRETVVGQLIRILIPD